MRISKRRNPRSASAVRADALQKRGCPLVWIEWEDSTQPQSRWQWLSDVKAPAVVKCVSVGFLIQDTDQVKTLAPNLGGIDDPESMQATGLITIPSRAVTRISPIREAKAR